MKVYLLKDIPGVGMAGEIVKVKEGYAHNFLIPQKNALEITAANSDFYEKRAKKIDERKEVVATKTSMLAEKIKSLKLTVKRKMHDDGKLYASVNAHEIADLLSAEGFSVGKNQVKIEKSIKERGEYDVIVKLTSKLQPKLRIKVVSE